MKLMETNGFYSFKTFIIHEEKVNQKEENKNVCSIYLDHSQIFFLCINKDDQRRVVVYFGPTDRQTDRHCGL